MKKRHIQFFLMGIFSLLILSSCNVQPVAEETFYLKYHMTGGFFGMSRKLEIFENRDVIYRDHEYSFKTQIDEANLLDIYQAIMNNNFLGLNTEYRPYMGADDFIYNITYVSQTDSQSVTTSGGALSSAIGLWKQRFQNVSQAINDYKSTIDMDMDSGYVIVLREYHLVQWPYSGVFKLSDHCDSAEVISSDIYNFVRDYDDDSDHYQYFENDTIYSIYTSGNNAINVYYPGLGIRWPFETPLSQIMDGGLGLYGDDYLWLEDTLDNDLHHSYFYDTATGENARAYQLWLRQGNLFE